MFRKYWTHKKYKQRKYVGNYGKSGTPHKSSTYERCFILGGIMKNGKVHYVTFESWQAAKAAGWELK